MGPILLSHCLLLGAVFTVVYYFEYLVIIFSTADWRFPKLVTFGLNWWDSCSLNEYHGGSRQEYDETMSVCTTPRDEDEWGGGPHDAQHQSDDNLMIFST